jgi:hypothetical protein
MNNILTLIQELDTIWQTIIDEYEIDENYGKPLDNKISEIEISIIKRMENEQL